MIAQRGESLAIFQNIAISGYRKIMFGTEDMGGVASAIARYRQRVKKQVLKGYSGGHRSGRAELVTQIHTVHIERGRNRATRCNG
jgi:hypothetical protein